MLRRSFDYTEPPISKRIVEAKKNLIFFGAERTGMHGNDSSRAQCLWEQLLYGLMLNI